MISLLFVIYVSECVSLIWWFALLWAVVMVLLAVLTVLVLAGLVWLVNALELASCGWLSSWLLCV